ncbi:hypothetical protein [Kiloniella sp.]|uniref:hypothetical protein n=1 Tax=Kiloniella sp. TaxID=1938587 RepID=UPI003B02E7F6
MAEKKIKKPPGVKTDAFRQHIIDEALSFADNHGWSQSTLGPLADHMGVEVNDIRAHFPDANAIANAWFTRAQDAMLGKKPGGFDTLPVRERINLIMLRWFDALAPHREVAAQIFCAKVHYPHIHHWAPAIFLLSRTIQLLRDAAGLHARGRRAQIEEIGLTALFLATLRGWCRDDSPDQERTRRNLDRRLQQIDRNILKLYSCAKV